MAPAHRTSGSGHTASPSTSTATAATMTATTSPPSPAGPPDPAGPVGTWDTTCFSELKPLLIVVFGFTCVAVCLLYAARFLLYCLDRHRHRNRHRGRAASREPKPPFDADDADDASPAVAGVWAEAECAICLAEFIDDGLEEGGGEAERVRVRVLPACGHGFHAACVEAWFATRASCPTCRAPSSSSRTTTRQP